MTSETNRIICATTSSVTLHYGGHKVQLTIPTLLAKVQYFAENIALLRWLYLYTVYVVAIKRALIWYLFCSCDLGFMPLLTSWCVGFMPWPISLLRSSVFFADVILVSFFLFFPSFFFLFPLSSDQVLAEQTWHSHGGNEWSCGLQHSYSLFDWCYPVR